MLIFGTCFLCLLFVNTVIAQTSSPALPLTPTIMVQENCVVNVQYIYDIVPDIVTNLYLVTVNSVQETIDTQNNPGPKFIFSPFNPSLTLNNQYQIAITAGNSIGNTTSASAIIRITSFTISGLSYSWDPINLNLVLNWTTVLVSTHMPLQVNYFIVVRYIYSVNAGTRVNLLTQSVTLSSSIETYSLSISDGSSAVFRIISIELIPGFICNTINFRSITQALTIREIQSPVPLGIAPWNPITIECAVISPLLETVAKYDFRFQNEYLNVTELMAANLLGGVFPSRRIITTTPIQTSPFGVGMTSDIILNTYAPSIDVNRLIGCRGTSIQGNLVETTYTLTTATNSSQPPPVILTNIFPSSSFTTPLVETIICNNAFLYAVWNNSYGDVNQTWPPTMFTNRRVWVGQNNQPMINEISTAYSSNTQRYRQSFPSLTHNLNTYYNYTIQVISDAGNSLESEALVFYVGTVQLSNVAVVYVSDRHVINITWTETSNSTIFGYTVNYRVEINYGNTNQLSGQSVLNRSPTFIASQGVHERFMEEKLYPGIDILAPGFAINRVSVNVLTQCGITVCDTIQITTDVVSITSSLTSGAMQVSGTMMLLVLLLAVIVLAQY